MRQIKTRHPRRLSLRPSYASGGTTTMNPGSGVLSGRRILIVEDEAIVSLMLEDLLTESGCIVIGPVGTTQSALRLIEQEPIDCAVLDIKLIDGTSLPVAEALAARGIRFVIATGYTREAIDPAYNGAPVLSKTFLPDELIDAIADILRP
jgi:DNA-binding response OmpR family regulator